MGFDIYGLKPVSNTRKPRRPKGDVEFQSPKWNRYFENMEKFYANNKGYYFRNNVWYWRPLAHIMCAVMVEKGIYTKNREETLSFNDSRTIDSTTAKIICDGLKELLRDRDRLNSLVEHYDDTQSYVFEVENLERFISFLEEANGFRVC